MRKLTSAITSALVFLVCGHAFAQLSDNVVKIGVLNDQSGPFADLGGPGSVIAARLAAEDVGGAILGVPVTVVSADHQNKADIASNIATRWFQSDAVDIIVDLPAGPVASAVHGVGRTNRKITIVTATSADALTNEQCSPTGLAWRYDYNAMSKVFTSALGGKDTKWFFITLDFAVAVDLESKMSHFIREVGGKIVGSVRHPPNVGDFSSFLLQAKASGADYIALATAGGDLINVIKQASEFGIVRGGQKLVGLSMQLTDVRSLGLPLAQKLSFVQSFYWDADDTSRAWAKRFQEKAGRAPTEGHALVYSATLHYLNAVKAAGTDEPMAVMAKMRERPVQDSAVSKGVVRTDGRMVHDILLVEVKESGQSSSEWDLLKVVKRVPGNEAFQPLVESKCPLK